MEKYITDERTGLKYELDGDYYFKLTMTIRKNAPSEYGGNGTHVT